MEGWVAVTHSDWFDLLARQSRREEVNFWSPSDYYAFHGSPGAPFFFKLKAPRNAIGGFGYVASFSRLPEWLAWECFGEGNGAGSLYDLRSRLGAIRERNELRGAGGPSQIGCIVIVQATFFPPDQWIPQPTDWAARNLRYKKYDLSQGKEFVFKYYGEQGNAFSSLDQIERVAIHPAFHSALGVKKPLGSVAPISVREAEDEDLVGASAAIAVRSIAASEQATQMMAALKETPLGMGGFRRYEELVRDVVAFAFTGYLDNGRMQERNWAGTQVRDVVFDNTGETLFFSHVRDKFHAITFLFECKNKETLEAADFHQMESRLSDATGNIGFICYRSNRAEPVRSEIEHLRSIFSRSHQQKLVMLLSDANLSQVLSKRLRGKLDRFMYSMLTRYASLYLAS